MKLFVCFAIIVLLTYPCHKVRGADDVDDNNDIEDDSDNDDDENEGEKEAKTISCFESRGVNLYKMANQTRDCLINTMSGDNWQKNYCRNYEMRVFPECFSDDFISAVKGCLDPVEFEELKEKIRERSNIICVEELKPKPNPQRDNQQQENRDDD